MMRARKGFHLGLSLSGNEFYEGRFYGSGAIECTFTFFELKNKENTRVAKENTTIILKTPPRLPRKPDPSFW